MFFKKNNTIHRKDDKSSNILIISLQETLTFERLK